MQCNIDAQGKRVRLIYGSALVIIGTLLAIFWARGAASWWPWMVVTAILGSGGFMIFESRKGWCIVRAMGFKTPI